MKKKIEAIYATSLAKASDKLAMTATVSAAGFALLLLLQQAIQWNPKDIPLIVIGGFVSMLFAMSSPKARTDFLSGILPMWIFAPKQKVETELSKLNAKELLRRKAELLNVLPRVSPVQSTIAWPLILAFLLGMLFCFLGVAWVASANLQTFALSEFFAGREQIRFYLDLVNLDVQLFQCFLTLSVVGMFATCIAIISKQHGISTIVMVKTPEDMITLIDAQIDRQRANPIA